MRPFEDNVAAEPPAVGAHAILGDGRAAALVALDGTLDWLCWPRFDSPWLFGALLDPTAGAFRVAPANGGRARRRYLPDTNVLETRFPAGGATLALVDFMPVASEDAKRISLRPEHEVLRLARAEGGDVTVVIALEARPRNGLASAPFTSRGALGWAAELPDGGELRLRSSAPLERRGDGLGGRVRLRAGEELQLSLTYTQEAPAVVPPLGERCRAALGETVRWWRAWASRLVYDGPHAERVRRSALALKLLSYAPSGAIVAAPTTSLPEIPGGAANWDYRYCWLRDAALTARSLIGLGFRAEAEDFVGWLIHATRLTHPGLRPLYDVFGNRPPAERELPLSGYRGARPVRVGNAARSQLQLDVYGELIDAAAQLFRDAREPPDGETRGLLIRLGDAVGRRWRERDAGLWESRAAPAEHTHSRLMSWVALDRLIELHERRLLPEVDGARLRRERAAVARELRTRGWNARLASYTQTLDGEDVDASLLSLAFFGFERADSPRMHATWRRVREVLGAGGARLYRNRDPATDGEGAFGICGFWAAEFLARGGGDVFEAHDLFDALCDDANDVGLFAEEVEPGTGAPRGNFPQAFTHVGLVNAALSLAAREAEETRAPPSTFPPLDAGASP